MMGGFSAEGRDLLRRVLARAACHHRGHDWREAAPRPDEAMAAIWRPVVLCWRCGQLDVGQR
jgi:hypothetical protein